MAISLGHGMRVLFSSWNNTSVCAARVCGVRARARLENIKTNKKKHVNHGITASEECKRPSRESSHLPDVFAVVLRRVAHDQGV